MLVHVFLCTSIHICLYDRSPLIRLRFVELGFRQIKRKYILYYYYTTSIFCARRNVFLALVYATVYLGAHLLLHSALIRFAINLQKFIYTQDSQGINVFRVKQKENKKIFGDVIQMYSRPSRCIYTRDHAGNISFRFMRRKQKNVQTFKV